MGGFVPIEDTGDPRLTVFPLNERGLANRAAKRDDPRRREPFVPIRS